MAGKYELYIYNQVDEDLDEIFNYITFEKMNPDAAFDQVDRIRNAIFTLDTFPDSHQLRMTGDYSDGRYSQLLVDNYVVIFRIDEEKKLVYIITVQYQGRNI